MRVRRWPAVVVATLGAVVMGVIGPAAANAVGLAARAPAAPATARSGATPVVTVTLRPTSARGAAAAAAAASTPNCQIADPENITGAMLVNNQVVNGTWTYITGFGACTIPVADAALYEELDFNGVKVNSKFQGFTGVARSADAILSQYVCAVCNGTWTILSGQILQAPNGFFWSNPPTGCVLVQNGVYLFCVQSTTVTI